MVFDSEDHILDSKIEHKSCGFESTLMDDIPTHKHDRNIRVAISELIPEMESQLVDPSYTTEQCYNNLQQLQELWSLVARDDLDMDEPVQKLAKIRS